MTNNRGAVGRRIARRYNLDHEGFTPTLLC
jgi:hypothetical protein